MKAFKVGDRVRTVKPNLEQNDGGLKWHAKLIDGECGKVIHIFKGGNLCIIPDNRNMHVSARPEWCELVLDTEIPGDIIKTGILPIVPAKKKIYTAGKVTGVHPNHAKGNFQVAKDSIEKWGFEAVSPLDYGEESKSWVENMSIALSILNTCDGIYLLDNWDDSDGARIEKKFAEKKGMFVIKEVV